MDSELLLNVQHIEIEILKYFKMVCEENDIDYFIIGGTLLGAIRHGGFIPWDDDIDVGMERAQYDTFIDVWQRDYLKQQDDYYLECKEIEPKTALPFAKLRKNRTLFVERETETTTGHKGIHIDIFPFDAIPEEDSIRLRIEYKIFKLLMPVTQYKNGRRSYSKIQNKILCSMLSIIPYSSINSFQMRVMKQYNDKAFYLITSFASGYGYRKHSGDRITVFGKGATVAFEGEEYSCPVNCDAYLTKLYGDYMVLPPIEKRISPHSIVQIDCGERF